ncbi:hypothetical protein [Histophilus somni]
MGNDDVVNFKQLEAAKLHY